LLDKSQSLPLNDSYDLPLTVIGSRSHTSEEFSEFVKLLNEKYGEVEFISSGSSLKFCLVAEGGADVYPRFGPTMEWDTAAWSGNCRTGQRKSNRYSNQGTTEV
jgi:3'(2'), 5'-bisphosphate nucleotidase